MRVVWGLSAERNEATLQSTSIVHAIDQPFKAESFFSCMGIHPHPHPITSSASGQMAASDHRKSDAFRSRLRYVFVMPTLRRPSLQDLRRYLAFPSGSQTRDLNTSCAVQIAFLCCFQPIQTVRVELPRSPDHQLSNAMTVEHRRRGGSPLTRSNPPTSRPTHPTPFRVPAQLRPERAG